MKIEHLVKLFFIEFNDLNFVQKRLFLLLLEVEKILNIDASSSAKFNKQNGRSLINILSKFLK